jgi:hypothetical protein
VYDYCVLFICVFIIIVKALPASAPHNWCHIVFPTQEQDDLDDAAHEKAQNNDSDEDELCEPSSLLLAGQLWGAPVVGGTDAGRTTTPKT